MNYIKKFICGNEGDAAISIILTVAIALIVAAFILLPGARTFANKVIEDFQKWWDTTISHTIFSTKEVI